MPTRLFGRGTGRRVGASAALLLVLTGCSAAPSTQQSERTPSALWSQRSAMPSRSVTPSPTPTREPARVSPRPARWVVGAKPLPRRPDGFGEVRRTPKQLRVRRLSTVDRMPAPRDHRFHASIGPITREVRRRMGDTWVPGCPVPLSSLRYLTLTFRGFDGRDHTGELVVNRSVARDVVRVFRELHAASYPIEEMRLVTSADLEAPPTGDGNNTAAYVCRATRGSTTWSAHAYGLAIDVNPFVNPYRKGDLVLPELASAYLDRSWRRPGMILPDGVVTRAFQAVGWTWGGTFSGVSDLMHFSADGR